MIHEEIARADLSFSYVNLLASLNSQILSRYGKPEVVRPWLAKIVAGEALPAIALTEPRGGSDAANLRLKIERVGDDYVINGEKTSISAADQADITVVFGRTGTPESGAHGVTALLVPMDTFRASRPTASTATASAPSAAARSSSRTCACPSPTAWATRTRASCR